LENISIPDSVTSISVNAFYGCKSLKRITISANVTQIESGAFVNCGSLESIEVAEDNKTYDSREGCNAIIETATNTLIRGCSSTVIPENIQVIERFAFSGSTMKELEIPESVREIGEGVVNYCNNLERIVVAEGNETYDSREGCNAIIETATNTLISGCGTTVIPDSVHAIARRAFLGTNLEEIVVPNGVTGLYMVFTDCKNLKKIVLPNSVREIYRGAFSGCSSLQSIVLSNGLTRVCGFKGCSSLQTIELPDSITTIDIDAFQDCTSLKNIVIHNNITEIDSCAFENCTSLQSIVIPESVCSLGCDAEGTFKGCSNLTDVTILSTSIDKTPESMFEGCKKLKEITLPKGIKKIGRRTFADCEELETITLPVGIAKINEDAFDGCKKLKTIYVPAKKADYYKMRLSEELHSLIVELVPEKKAKKK
jgi:hypothetical protein